LALKNETAPMSSIQKLRVLTSELATPEDFDLTRHFPENPTAFVRNGQGLIGFGEAARFETSGLNRISELATAWREQVEQSEITDPLQVQGTGLVGFGSATFSPDSTLNSVLIIPRIILGIRDGRGWITKITPEGEPEATSDFYLKALTYRDNEKLSFVEGAMTSAAFLKQAKKAISKIRSGKLKKMVLAREIMAQIPEGFDLRTGLQSLAKKYPSCWVYSVDGNFGASPELLVRVSHGQVSARVLAGTTSRGDSPESDVQKSNGLVASEKNLAEHRFAVESMVEALSPFCLTVDADEKPFSLALPDLWHLASDVYGKLKNNISVLDLAAFLHPTAAVAGTARHEAQALIAELEPFDRGGYAGPVGWIGADGDGEWAIALRGGYIEENVLTAFAGCGLVADSEPEAELEETELKFAPVRGALS
jgi:menaquinone-specific isochorismate synthase